MKFLLTLATALSLSSCAFHHGTMTGNASITNADFRVVDFGMGTSITQQFLGIGGLKKQGLVLEAKRSLYNSYPLRPGQALANVTVDFKRAFIGPYSKTTCTVTADIIDFNDPLAMDSEPTTTIDQKTQPELVQLVESENGFTRGENILVLISKLAVPGEIKSFESGKILVQHRAYNNALYTKAYNRREVYKTESSISEYKVGRSIEYNKNGPGTTSKFRGTIIGTNPTSVLVKYSVGGKTTYERVINNNITRVFTAAGKK